MFYVFFPLFVGCCPCNFKQGQAECVLTMRAQKSALSNAVSLIYS